MQFYYFLTIFVVLLLNYQQHDCLPAGRTPLSQCYGRECPEKTTSCFKHTQVTDDKEHMNITIKCLDVHGKALETFSEEQDNPFGPNFYFQGISLTGVFQIGGDDNSENTGDNESTTTEVKANSKEKGEKDEKENGLETLD